MMQHATETSGVKKKRLWNKQHCGWVEHRYFIFIISFIAAHSEFTVPRLWHWHNTFLPLFSIFSPPPPASLLFAFVFSVRHKSIQHRAHIPVEWCSNFQCALSFMIKHIERIAISTEPLYSLFIDLLCCWLFSSLSFLASSFIDAAVAAAASAASVCHLFFFVSGR